MSDHLEGLNESQRAAAIAPAPQLVLAGAGSGKTETLARRAIDLILQRDEPPERLLCITFTNRAAAEMRARMAMKLGPRAPHWVGTFHACMARLLTEDAGAAVEAAPRGFTILDPPRSRALVGQLTGIKDVKEMAMVQEAVSLLRNYGVKPKGRPPKTPALTRFEGEVLDQAMTVLPAYIAELRRQRVLDFDDLLVVPAEAMEQDPALAARWSARWSEILVDEYQDTNAAQHRLLRLLASGHGRVFAVGDDCQSIYGWRGAEIAHIRRFGQDFPKARQAIKLETNYRSTRTILAAANAIAAKDPEAMRKTLHSAAPLGVAGAAIALYGVETAEEEGRAVISWIRGLRQQSPDQPLRECAVLVRAGFVSEPIMDALREAGVPAQMVSDREADLPREVLAVIAWLRLSLSRDADMDHGERWDAAADDAFRRACVLPRRPVTGQAFARLRQHATEGEIAFADAVPTAPISEPERKAFAAVLDVARLIQERIMARRTKSSEALQIAADLSGLADALSDSAPLRRSWQALLGRADRLGSVHDFAEASALGALDVEPEGPDSIQVMTLHRAKGLEFDHVFMAGLEEGIFPSRKAEQQGTLPEERRLFYVGLTRARYTLRLSYVHRRRQWKSNPSRFIAEIPRNLLTGSVPAAKAETGDKTKSAAGRKPSAATARKLPSEADTARMVAAFKSRKRVPSSRG
ncbi:ATP-dependent helicase [Acidisoma cellulosilytica]|uniref:DNA 3'-5' helicase n=1 Tax=Acidisoma cellulosilyticum TaxID=2802395 RepID=A0A963Z014_9PROT|nr:ATP-dependent helicase [Acidisoma cellulosilyticum]MCB8880061.1 ATP-dependent helicase [Acidisoma cellulosilyticum]